jgi:hypothetical protein
MASRKGMKKTKVVSHPHQNDVFGAEPPDPHWEKELAWPSVYEHWDRYWAFVGESGSTNEEAVEVLCVGMNTVSASAYYLNKAGLLIPVGNRHDVGNLVRIPNPKAAGRFMGDLRSSGMFRAVAKVD